FPAPAAGGGGRGAARPGPVPAAALAHPPDRRVGGGGSRAGPGRAAVGRSAAGATASETRASSTPRQGAGTGPPVRAAAVTAPAPGGGLFPQRRRRHGR